MVVHLLLINEHFLVWNLYINGNGNGFSRTLESNIWDYIICSCVEVSRKVCDVLLGCWNIPAMASQRYDPYQLHFIFCIVTELSAISPTLSRALFPDIQVSCKDTAPCYVFALLVPVVACGRLFGVLVGGRWCGVPVLGSVGRWGFVSRPLVGIMKMIAALRIMKFALSEVGIRGCFLVCF